MIELFAKNFDTRARLEAKVSSLMGLTADSKPDYLIKGTRQELRKLSLGDGKVFWGIRVEEVGKRPVAKIKRVDRGKVFKSKLESINIDNSEEI